jgi:hypothetical protein
MANMPFSAKNMPFSAKYAISGPIRSNMPFPAKSGVDNF